MKMSELVRVLSDEESSQWQQTIAAGHQSNQAAMVRAERNGLLEACDWTQIPDSPMTTEQRAAWATYRQELRNISAQAGFPAQVAWPEPPSTVSTGGN